MSGAGDCVRLRFRTVFLWWFVGLLLLFLAANLEVREAGLLRIQSMGFPLVFANWKGPLNIGSDLFEPELLALNVVIALTVSVSLAALCAWSRCRGRLLPSPTFDVDTVVKEKFTRQ
jgi:hypothetical protein